MLESVDPGFGIEVVTLAAERVEILPEREIRLEAIGEITAEDGIAPLVDRLANRLGEDRVWRAQAYPSHIPERVVVRILTVMQQPGGRSLAEGPSAAGAAVRPARTDHRDRHDPRRPAEGGLSVGAASFAACAGPRARNAWPRNGGAGRRVRPARPPSATTIASKTK